MTAPTNEFNPTGTKRVLIDLTGQQFGRLLVVGFETRSDDGKSYWKCLCECGTNTVVAIDKLRSGHTQSCGCLQKEATANLATHGHTRGSQVSGTYKSWSGMFERCENPNNHKFPDYGGRGISVCERWRIFENFLADMGERPDGKSIDRYPNNDGNYEPGNCRWATQKEQQNNRRKPKKDVENTCIICLSVFLTASQSKYCTHDCYLEYRRRSRKVDSAL